MLTFAEEIMLLILDDDGSFLPTRGGAMEYILAGAVLMDLAFANRIDTDLEHLTCLDTTPTGNPILDQALAHITNSSQPKDTRGWIETLAGQDTTEIRQQALASLIERGILESQDKKFLWVFRARRYPTIDGRVEREVRLRISDVLLSDDIPDPRDVAMICLVDAAGFLRDIFTAGELERATPRVEQLRKMDLIGHEVGSVIAEIERSVMMAMAISPH